VLSPLARDAINNLMRGHYTTFEEQFLRLYTPMKVLITDFIERSKLGMLRNRTKNRVTKRVEGGGAGLSRSSRSVDVAPKVELGRAGHHTTPVKVNMRDPKDRLMILLGYLNGGDGLNESESSEAITIAQKLRNSGRLSQKEFQKVSSALN